MTNVDTQGNCKPVAGVAGDCTQITRSHIELRQQGSLVREDDDLELEWKRSEPFGVKIPRT